MAVHTRRNSWGIEPDLVLIDGGKGHLGAALQVFLELGINDIPLASLAKENEEVFVPMMSESIVLPRNSQGLYLIQRARDEAHRFRDYIPSRAPLEEECSVSIGPGARHWAKAQAHANSQIRFATWGKQRFFGRDSRGPRYDPDTSSQRQELRVVFVPIFMEYRDVFNLRRRHLSQHLPSHSTCKRCKQVGELHGEDELRGGAFTQFL